MKHLSRIRGLSSSVLLLFIFGCTQLFFFAKPDPVLEKKIVLYLKIIEVFSDTSYCADYYCELSRMYNELGKIAETREYNEKWVDCVRKENNSGDIEKSCDLACYEKVLKVCDQFISSDPNFVYAYIEKANVCMILQRIDEAFKIMNKAVSSNPENVEVYAFRSAMYAKIHQEEKSRMDEKKAEELLAQKVEEK